LGGTDREYDSFEQFVHEDRGLAFMVVAIVFVVFLTPVLITALLIWYKLRKNRMLNETMIKLAERGVVPPAEALQALHSGGTAAAASAMVARAPLMEQVKTLRTQAAWSDLRKGVILVATGLSFVAYSMIDDRSPSSQLPQALRLLRRRVAREAHAMPSPILITPGCRLPRSPMHNSLRAHWLGTTATRLPNSCAATSRRCARVCVN
jgi:hypothetical protein